jgi:hypothetical protein
VAENVEWRSVVAEIPIRQEEIDNLAQQLDSIDSNEQKALLSGIVALAGKAINSEPTEDGGLPKVTYVGDLPSPVVVETDGSLPSFHEQIAHAFKPGTIEEADDTEHLRVIVGHVLSVRVRRDPQS